MLQLIASGASALFSHRSSGLSALAKGVRRVIYYRLTVAPEIIACVGEGRDPTVPELGRLADRVHLEIWGSRTAFAWGAEQRDNGTRLASFRIAHAALTGSPAEALSDSDIAPADESELA